MQRPAWEAHISVIANEMPPNIGLWRAYDGQEIAFSYEPAPEFNGIYVWLPVICERALDIREELGLPRQPFYPLHLTIGNNKYEEMNQSTPAPRPTCDSIEEDFNAGQV